MYHEEIQGLWVRVDDAADSVCGVAEAARGAGEKVVDECAVLVLHDNGVEFALCALCACVGGV